jgi:hypothetical protein
LTGTLRDARLAGTLCEYCETRCISLFIQRAEANLTCNSIDSDVYFVVNHDLERKQRINVEISAARAWGGDREKGREIRSFVRFSSVSLLPPRLRSVHYYITVVYN